jgi:hypothetical protein
MLTFFVRISAIHGCSSMRQGDARRGGSFSRLYGGISTILRGSYMMKSLKLTSTQ